MQAQRDLEDEALRLGSERNGLEAKLGKNLEQIVDLLAQAPEHSVSVERFASLVGVRRQQLYRWRDVIARLRQAAED
jgi:transcriptional regulator GlxA family with amidase domain